MDKIVCLVGHSGCGKTTIAKELERKGFNVIHSYTTRKPRKENEWGHLFVDDKDEGIKASKDMLGCGLKKVIAYTFYDNHHYWATVGQYKGEGTSIYPVDMRGVKQLKKTIQDAEIKVIFLQADEINRLNRMLDRLEVTDCSKEEISILTKNIFNRIEHDKKAFETIECDYAVDGNREVEDVVRLITSIIKQ